MLISFVIFAIAIAYVMSFMYENENRPFETTLWLFIGWFSTTISLCLLFFQITGFSVAVILTGILICIIDHFISKVNVEPKKSNDDLESILESLSQHVDSEIIDDLRDLSNRGIDVAAALQKIGADKLDYLPKSHALKNMIHLYRD